MSRFKPLGNFIYENGDRIGCTVEEANVEIAQKLNAYQMRIERLKAEVERLRKAGDLLAFHYISLGRKFFPTDPLPSSIDAWNAAKEGKPNA